MKKITITLGILLFSLAAFAQQGTDFRHISLDEALSAARQEGKYVFVDCYTSWCGPCKNMTENIFPQKKVADYFNPKFVSVKYDIEKEEDGISLAKAHGIKSIPTFLVFRPDGTLVYKIVGGSLEADDFLKKAEETFDDEKAVASLKKISEKGGDKGSSLANNFTTVGDTQMRESLQELLEDATFEEKTSLDYWFIYSILRLTPKGSANEEFLFDNFEEFRRNVGREKVDKQLGMRYHDLLKDIAEERTKVTHEQLARILGQVERADLDPAYNITPYAKLSEALYTGDMDTLIEAAEQYAPATGLWTYAVMYDKSAIKGITPEQQKAWVAIAEKVRPMLTKDKESSLDPILKGIADRMEKRRLEALQTEE